jgi:hypothetical protein
MEAGRAYYVRVSAARGHGGDLSIGVAIAPTRPANDDLADAMEIDSPMFVDWRDTTHATDETDEVPASCGGAAGVPDAGVWYRLQRQSTGPVQFTTQGSNFDTVLSVWTGGPGHPLDELECNDDADGTWSEVSFTAEAGTVYYIKAGGAGGERGVLSFGSPFHFVFIPVAVR